MFCKIEFGHLTIFRLHKILCYRHLNCLIIINCLTTYYNIPYLFFDLSLCDIDLFFVLNIYLGIEEKLAPIRFRKNVMMLESDYRRQTQHFRTQH